MAAAAARISAPARLATMARPATVLRTASTHSETGRGWQASVTRTHSRARDNERQPIPEAPARPSSSGVWGYVHAVGLSKPAALRSPILATLCRHDSVFIVFDPRLPAAW